MTTNRVTEEPGEVKVSRPVLQGGGGWQRPSPTQRQEGFEFLLDLDGEVTRPT